MKSEEGTTKKPFRIFPRSTWKIIAELLILIILGGGAAIFQAAQQHAREHPDLDDPPFGLTLPDSVTANGDETWEEDMLSDYPDNYQCQSYLLDDRLDSVVDFYLDSVTGWGEPIYKIAEEDGIQIHLSLYEKGEGAQGQIVIIIKNLDKARIKRAEHMVIFGFEGE